ncbi:hypothetical protein [Desulfatibacillum aliphaticivorans]|uniref:hypothetical protein n=1 Tax=Desulfatibacillum aliphaticivorans TaxID=218208 RepID=UPI00040CA944|nr:hypothetical protein [Desulfatibacillum aliphaticivorans]
MEGLNLEPFAMKLHLRPTSSGAASVCEAAVLSVVKSLADKCSKENRAVIGHLKAFAQDDQGAWMRVSAVDAKHAPSVEGGLAEALDHVHATLNAHVLGLSSEKVEKLVMESIEEAQKDACVEINCGGTEKCLCAHHQS